MSERSNDSTVVPNKIHLVFKTHLDIGYTNFAKNVIDDYFSIYIPAAIRLATELRAARSKYRYIWTTGSWLINEYLQQASKSDKQLLVQAIESGDVVWHGLPFSTHSELMGPELFRAGLSISQALDKQFGKSTIAAKMTDVPGHTRAIVPLLAEAGIKLIHIGVNPHSSAPNVPPVFIWRNSDGTEVIVVYQDGGYGDLTNIKGHPSALAFAHTSDNVGPHTSTQVDDIFNTLQAKYPTAPIQGSTLNEFAHELVNSDIQLPVITQEIGDTWIHGAASDPTKIRRFRELSRVHRELLNDGTAKTLGRAFYQFQAGLMMIPEHTWGLSSRDYLDDFSKYNKADFHNARKYENFQSMEASWLEQRQYLEKSLAAIKTFTVGADIKRRLANTEPKLPDLSGYRVFKENTYVVQTTHYNVQLDPNNGSIIGLREKASGRKWAGPDNPLGKLTYEVFSQADYDKYHEQYIYKGKRSQPLNLKEPCSYLNTAAAVNSSHLRCSPTVIDVWVRNSTLSEDILIELGAPLMTVEQFGCPAQFFLELSFPKTGKGMSLTLQWFDKPASRIPEAIWFAFSPKVISPDGWKMDKMGQQISPFEVLDDGNKKLHAVLDSVNYSHNDGELIIKSLDAPLVSPGDMTIWDFNNDPPACANGMQFLLYNNLWGTNFPLWFEDDAKFRFELLLEGE